MRRGQHWTNGSPKKKGQDYPLNTFPMSIEQHRLLNEASTVVNGSLTTDQTSNLCRVRSVGFLQTEISSQFRSRKGPQYPMASKFLVNIDAQNSHLSSFSIKAFVIVKPCGHPFARMVPSLPNSCWRQHLTARQEKQSVCTLHKVNFGYFVTDFISYK